MPDTKYLRDLAARMFVLSLTTNDENLARSFALRASDYLDQAIDLERVETRPPEPETT